MLMLVATALGPLRDQVAFVGGAVTTLYIDDPAAPQSVATEDIDCVVELSNLLSFETLERKLRQLGFKQPVPEGNAPICRWALGEIRVDVMPTDSKILGFTNRWYTDGLVNRQTKRLPDGTSIFVFSLPYFIASKIEAVKGRGGNDLRFSHDLEDIVLVASGASDFEKAFESAPKEVRAYIKKEIEWLSKNESFNEAIEASLAARREDLGRAVEVQRRFRTI